MGSMVSAMSARGTVTTASWMSCSKRKSIMAILKEIMTNEASVLLDSDAANKALDADAALQELGSDFVGEAYVTATVTVWDEDARIADDRLWCHGRVTAHLGRR